jgi:hypothetical protein
LHGDGLTSGIIFVTWYVIVFGLLSKWYTLQQKRYRDTNKIEEIVSKEWIEITLHNWYSVIDRRNEDIYDDQKTMERLGLSWELQ